MRSVVVKNGDLEPDLSAYFVVQASPRARPWSRETLPNAPHRFHEQPDVPVVGGAFSLPVQPGDLWTLTTVGTMTKGAVAAPPPPPGPFATSPPYADDFEACPQFQEAPYFTDQARASGDARGAVVSSTCYVLPLPPRRRACGSASRASALMATRRR